MRNLLKKISSFASNHSLILASLLAAVVVPAAVLAWGSSRETFTVEKPATYNTFNSITNNPDIGDERNFVRAREVNGTQWSDDISITKSGEYFVRLYVHNNAADNLNLTAENVVAQLNVPTYQAKKIQIDGSLTSSNSKPNKVFDQVIFSSNENFKLNYVAGSATYTNNVFTGGTKLPDSLVNGSGATLGYDKLDGKIPGCFEYSGWVAFKVKAEVIPQGDFTVNKTVRKEGATDWAKSITVNPGDKVDYQIEFKNTGKTQLDNVVIKDTLPKGATIVPGSVYLKNASGLKNITDGLVGGGTNIGAYTADSNAFLKFTAKISDNDQLPACGANTLTNTVSATTSVGKKDSTADVKVSKKCEQPKVPGVSIKKTVNGKDKITIEANKEFTYELVVKNTGEVDLKDVNVTDKAPTNVQFISADKGTISNNALSYKIAELKVDQSQTIKIKARATKEGITAKNTACVDTPTVPGSPDDCDDAEIETPKPVYTCDALSITKVNRTKFEFNTDYTVRNTDFKGVKYIIKDASGKVVTEKTVNNGTKLTYDNQNTGKYTVEAIVITGKGEATSAKCKGQFEVVEEDKPGISIQKTVNGKENIKIDVNTEFTYELVVRNTGNVDLKNAVVTDNAPENVKFISADKGEIKDNKFTYRIPTLKVGASETIKIKAIATKEGNTAKNTACVDTPTVSGSPDDCDDANIEVPPKPPVIPEEPSTPETPPELPQTGMTEAVSALIGAGSITAALGYYIASRRQLL